MRILQLITRRQRRGAEVFATELADALSGRGHCSVVAGIYTPVGTPLEPERAGCVDLDATPGLRLNPRTVVGLGRLIGGLAPDVVQANGSDTLKYAVLARLATGGRWPLVYRNISVASRWLRGPLHRSWNQALVRQVEHVVGVSRASCEDFARTYGVKPERMSMIPQAVRLPDLLRVPQATAAAAARRTLAALTGAPAGAALLMHVGSFTPEKNHLWLLDAFRGVLAHVPAAHLVLAGDGALRTRIEERVRELHLEARVHLLGSRADASELVAAADLLVLPSLVEGLPGVVLEAAAQAVPAVASRVGGVAEALRHGETGLLFEAGDANAFVTAVTSLLEDPVRRRALGLAAQALAGSAFNLEEAASRYEALYRRLIEAGASGTIRLRAS